MVFSSPVFLTLFLPVVLAVYFVVPRAWRNGVLLGASLLFYAWGEQGFVLVMLASILCNWVLGLLIERFRERDGAARWVVAAAVVLNIGLLGVFKYAYFVVDNLSAVMVWLGAGPVEISPVHLPIGISFFTFQALSYVIDVYRRDAEVQTNPVHSALYISLFPQLIAGPIVRYHDIASMLAERVVTRARFASGIRRFVVGLGKKVLVANVVARPADAVFAMPGSELTASLAWLGVVCYALQIYFDFSGYSDMAIGLGRMFGFELLENFRYPYISQSIQEFWRRWHISLSSWFRDYLYIPLGGNRRGPVRTYLNLLIVFFITGLWHGASWSFVIWGLFHGLFLILERLGLRQRLETVWRPLRHAYVLLVVLGGWVLFRAASLGQAGAVAAAMVGLGHGSGVVHPVWLLVDTRLMLMLAAGALTSAPVVPWLVDRVCGRVAGRGLISGLVELGGVAILAAVLVLCLMDLAAGTHNPFIYFRF